MAKTPKATVAASRDRDTAGRFLAKATVSDAAPARDSHGRFTVKASDSLTNALSGQGTSKDSRTQRYYTKLPRRSFTELEAMYQHSWLAGKIVDIPPFEMTREWREFTLEDGKARKELETAEKRLGVRAKFREALQWAELYGGGAIILGIDGMGDASQPLNVEAVKKDALKFIHVLDRTWIHPAAIEPDVYDPTSPEFMLPEQWYIANANHGAQSIAKNAPTIHRSRIIRFPGLALPLRAMQQERFWGQSRLERIEAAVMDADSVTAGIAELVGEAKVDVFKIANLMGLVGSPEGEATIKKRVSLATQSKSIWNAIILDAEEDYQQKTDALAQGLAPLMGEFLAVVAAAADIPITRLLGEAAKGLNATGEGDARNFYDMIAARQENYLRTQLEQFDEVFVRSVLGRVPDEFGFDFPPLWQMSDKEVAELQKLRADRDAIYLRDGVVDEVVVAKQLQEKQTYDAIDDEYIKELETALENEPEPAPLVPLPPGGPGGPPAPPGGPTAVPPATPEADDDAEAA